MRDIPPTPTNGHRSQLEADTAAYLDTCGYHASYEPVTIRSQGRTYTPDFLAICNHSAPNGARTLIEVKPNREIAAIELRNDMLVETSTLWLVCDIFIVAFTQMPWMCRTKYGEWHDCTLTPDDGLTIDSSPSIWEPEDLEATVAARRGFHW